MGSARSARSSTLTPPDGVTKRNPTLLLFYSAPSRDTSSGAVLDQGLENFLQSGCCCRASHILYFGPWPRAGELYAEGSEAAEKGFTTNQRGDRPISRAVLRPGLDLLLPAATDVAGERIPNGTHLRCARVAGSLLVPKTYTCTCPLGLRVASAVPAGEAKESPGYAE